jgi:hypothetical protein
MAATSSLVDTEAQWLIDENAINMFAKHFARYDLDRSGIRSYWNIDQDEIHVQSLVTNLCVKWKIKDATGKLVTPSNIEELCETLSVEGTVQVDLGVFVKVARPPHSPACHPRPNSSTCCAEQPNRLNRLRGGSL